MSSMLRVLKWRIKIYLNNKFVILLFLIVPILLTLWLAEDLDKQELGSISVSIIDEDNTAISSKYVNKLKEDSKISTVELEYDESIEEVKKEKLSAVILVKDGFSDRILKGENQGNLKAVLI
jgi:ABC-2 type transport system permease protein